MNSGENSIINGLEQGRAAFAYNCALKASKVLKTDTGDEYKSYVNKMPMLIKANGLGPALAFISAKKENDQKKKGYAYKLIYEHIGEWLKIDSLKQVKLEKGKDLVNEVIKLDSTTYRAVTNEVLAFLSWLRRFADSVLEETENTEEVLSAEGNEEGA